MSRRPLTCLLAAAAVLALASPFAAQSASAQDPATPLLAEPEPRLLIGSNFEDRNGSLRSYDATGQDGVLLSDGFVPVRRLALDRDGAMVASTGEPGFDLRVGDVWGGRRGGLHPRAGTAFVFSPDGGRVAHHDGAGFVVTNVDIAVTTEIGPDPDPVFRNDPDVEADLIGLHWPVANWIVGIYQGYPGSDEIVGARWAINVGTGDAVELTDVATVGPSGTVYAAVDTATAREAILSVHDIGSFPTPDQPRWERSVEKDPDVPFVVGLLRFNSDGTRLAVQIESVIEVLDTADGRSLWSLDTADRWVEELRWSADGSRLAVSTSTSIDDTEAGTPVSLVTVSRDGDDVRHVIVEQERGPRQLIDWTGASTMLVVDPDEFRPTVQGLVQDVTADGPPVVSQLELDDDVIGRATVATVQPGPVDRYAGATRISTAVALSRAAFPDGASGVVIARADLYPDALAGAALAGKIGGPLILTNETSFEEIVIRELDRLGPTRAYILGTTDVLGPELEDQLRGRVSDVRRLGGETRFDTAALVAAEVAPDDGEVYLVEGRNADPNRGWPDAVAVAGRAATEQRPILLTDADMLPSATARAIRDGGVTSVTIVGGEVAVSRAVEDQIKGTGVEVRRIAGDTRYSTSAMVVRDAGALTLPFVVTGQNWPDALAAGPAAAHVGGQVLLVPTPTIGGSAAMRLIDEADVDRVAVIGSTSVVSQRIVRELRDVIR